MKYYFVVNLSMSDSLYYNTLYVRLRIYILTNNLLTQIFRMLIIDLMLGQVVWKMHKLQKMREDGARLARGRV